MFSRFDPEAPCFTPCPLLPQKTPSKVHQAATGSRSNAIPMFNAEALSFVPGSRTHNAEEAHSSHIPKTASLAQVHTQNTHRAAPTTHKPAASRDPSPAVITTTASAERVSTQSRTDTIDLVLDEGQEKSGKCESVRSDSADEHEPHATVLEYKEDSASPKHTGEDLNTAIFLEGDKCIEPQTPSIVVLEPTSPGLRHQDQLLLASNIPHLSPFKLPYITDYTVHHAETMEPQPQSVSAGCMDCQTGIQDISGSLKDSPDSHSTSTSKRTPGSSGHKKSNSGVESTSAFFKQQEIKEAEKVEDAADPFGPSTLVPPHRPTYRPHGYGLYKKSIVHRDAGSISERDLHLMYRDGRPENGCLTMNNIAQYVRENDEVESVSTFADGDQGETCSPEQHRPESIALPDSEGEASPKHDEGEGRAQATNDTKESENNQSSITRRNDIRRALADLREMVEKHEQRCVDELSAPELVPLPESPEPEVEERQQAYLQGQGLIRTAAFARKLSERRRSSRRAASEPINRVCDTIEEEDVPVRKSMKFMTSCMGIAGVDDSPPAHPPQPLSVARRRPKTSSIGYGTFDRSASSPAKLETPAIIVTPATPRAKVSGSQDSPHTSPWRSITRGALLREQPMICEMSRYADTDRWRASRRSSLHPYDAQFPNDAERYTPGTFCYTDSAAGVIEHTDGECSDDMHEGDDDLHAAQDNYDSTDVESKGLVHYADGGTVPVESVLADNQAEDDNEVGKSLQSSTPLLLKSTQGTKQCYCMGKIKQLLKMVKGVQDDHSNQASTSLMLQDREQSYSIRPVKTGKARKKHSCGRGLQAGLKKVERCVGKQVKRLTGSRSIAV